MSQVGYCKVRKDGPFGNSWSIDGFHQLVAVSARYNSAQNARTEHGATRTQSRLTMRAKLDQISGNNWQTASYSRRSAMVMLEQPTQAGCKYNVTRQIAVLPLPTSCFLEGHVILGLMRPFRVVPGDIHAGQEARLPARCHRQQLKPGRSAGVAPFYSMGERGFARLQQYHRLCNWCRKECSRRGRLRPNYEVIGSRGTGRVKCV